MKYRIFRLTTEIENPLYNRRYKSGFLSVKTFKAGSLVRAHETRPRQGEPYTSYQIGPDWFYAEGYLEEEVARQDPGVEMPIQTLEEAAAASGVNTSYFCGYVVRQLIEEGRLYPAEAKELYERRNQ